MMLTCQVILLIYYCLNFILSMCQANDKCVRGVEKPSYLVAIFIVLILAGFVLYGAGAVSLILN